MKTPAPCQTLKSLRSLSVCRTKVGRTVVLGALLLQFAGAAGLAQDLTNYFNRFEGSLDGINGCLTVSTQLVCRQDIEPCLRYAGFFAAQLVADAEALVADIKAAGRPPTNSVAAFGLSNANRLRSSAKSVQNSIAASYKKCALTAVAKAKPQLAALAQTQRQFQRLRLVSFDKPFLPFSPAPWGLSMTDDLVGWDAPGFTRMGDTVTVQVNVPEGMRVGYFMAETAADVFTTALPVGSPTAPIELESGLNTLPMLTFGSGVGGARVVLVALDEYGQPYSPLRILRSRLFFNKADVLQLPSGGLPPAPVNNYDGTYLVVSFQETTPMGPTSGGGDTFQVVGGNFSAGGFSGTVDAQGNLVNGSIIPAPGANPVPLTGRFSLTQTFVLSGSNSAVTFICSIRKL